MLNTWPTNDALNCRVRPFGVSLHDLDMEFNEAATVSVTQLLQSCLLKDIDNTYFVTYGGADLPVQHVEYWSSHLRLYLQLKPSDKS